MPDFDKELTDKIGAAVGDGAGLEEECRFARSLGFRGKACIHPAQIPIVNRAIKWPNDRVRNFDVFDVALNRVVA